MTRLSRVGFLFSALWSLLLTGESIAANWIHWRGPEQTGFSRETNLPDEWDPGTPGRHNLVGKNRTAADKPLVMNGKVYITGAFGDNPGVPVRKKNF